MLKNVTAIAAELPDREAIRDCVYRFCRGVDRVDKDLIFSAFWPDATAEYGNFEAESSQDFLEKSLAVLRTLEMTWHSLGNIIIDIQGDTAYVESYVRAIQRVPNPAGDRFDYVSASRYLDRLERRNGEWRIKHRTIVRDWFREFPDSFDWKDGAFPQSAGYGKNKPLNVGARKPDDPSYALFEHSFKADR